MSDTTRIFKALWDLPPQIAARDGMACRIEADLGPDDSFPETTMYRVRFDDGYSMPVFADELDNPVLA